MEKNNIDIDTSLYNEKSLYLLNIRELRDIGRKFGVPAPASLKKQELVDYILKIVYGEVVVPVRSLRGRPSVREFDMNKYLDKIKKNSELTSELVKVKLDHEYDLGFGLVASPTAGYGNVKNIKHRVFFDDGEKCYLRVREFVASKDDIECPKELATKLNLENFDVLEVLENDGLFKIVTINGKKLDHNLKNITLDNEIIGEGTNPVFYYRTKEEIKEKIDNLAKECADQNIKCIVFATKKYTYSTTETIVYDNNDSMEQVYKKIMMIFSLAEKTIFENEDVLVLVENFADIENCLKSFEDDVAERSQTLIEQKIQKIISLDNSFVVFKQEKHSSY